MQVKIFECLTEVLAGSLIFAPRSHDASASKRSRKEPQFTFLLRPGTDEMVDLGLGRR